jgi:hypothetical protein
MKTLEFERLRRGTYAAWLHACGYSIPITEEVLEQLKKMDSSPPGVFLKAVCEKLGHNRYLKELIEEAIRKGGEPDLLGRALQEEILKV